MKKRLLLTSRQFKKSLKTLTEGYYSSQLEPLLSDISQYGYKIQLRSVNAQTKWMDITEEELREIYHLLQKKEMPNRIAEVADDSAESFMYENTMEEGATLESHANVVSEIRRIIHSGVFCSMLYIKADGSLRAFNIHKEPMSAVEKLQGMPKYDPKDHNILRIWDNNAVKGDQRGDWRSAKVDGIVYFKRGNTVYDFTEVNADKISRVDPNMLNAMVKQMGIIRDGSNVIKVT